MTTETRSLPDEPDRAARLADHLYCIADGERLGTSWRFALTGYDTVEIGRGKDDLAVPSGGTLRLDRADPWMSGVHARLVREGLLWAVEDAGARNGVRVNGRRIRRTVVDAGDLIELGRSFFVVRRGEMAAEPVLAGATEPGGTATVVPAFARRLAQLARVAPTGAPVLLRGATGTGKERLAAHVHALSRRTGPLVPVNCGAIPATLVESELFGHRRGAFSGAAEARAGLAAAADGGTLFLDEVAELPPAAQVALLRLLEQKEVRPLGATAPTHVDLRIVAATHRDLARLCAAGAFRDDLAARLVGFEVVIPSLADRIVDLGIILGEVVPPHLTPSNGALRAIASYRWPRNVRELVRAVEQAVALAQDGSLEAADLPESVRGGAPVADHDPMTSSSPGVAPPGAAAGVASSSSSSPAIDLPEDDEQRRAALVELLEKHQGNVTRIAAELGKARMQVQRWLARYGLDAAAYRP